MTEYTEISATDIVFPHIEVYRKYRDGEHYGYKIIPEDGYHMYDTTTKDTEYDPETGKEIEIINYCQVIHASLIFDFEDFPWRAVALADVEDPTHIY